MALFEDLADSFMPSALVGIGAILLAPLVIPAVSNGLRPLTKTIVKGGLIIGDKIYSVVAEAGEQFSDIVAEARSEIHNGGAVTEAAAGVEGAAGARRRRSRAE